MNRLSRRDFVKCMGGAGACVALGWPRHAAWALQGGRPGMLRFVFYTDIHTRVEWDTPQALEQAAASINQQHADIAMAGGDLITDGFDASAEAVAPRWDAYLKMHRSIRAEVHPVLGNHDLVGVAPADGSDPEENPRRDYLERVGLDRTWYSFTAMGYHFMVLDSLKITGDDDRYHGYIDEEQQEWIRADLARVAKDTPVIVASHMPLLTSFFQATEGATAAAPPNRVVTNSRDVLKLFAEHNLALVLQGHLHVNEMLRWRNTTFITGGAVSGCWWRGEWHGTKEGYGVVTLAQNRVQWDYIEYGWTARRPPHL